MKTPYKKSAATILAILLACLGFSSNSYAENRAYNIEVIIFKYNKPTGFSAESWPEKWSLPDISTSREVFSKPSKSSATPITPTNNGQFLDGGKSSKPRKKGFRRLASSNFQLKKEAKRLRASSRYTVLRHLAWKQPGLNAKQATPVRIRAGKAYEVQNFNGSSTLSYEIDGSIKVVLGRYLHVYTDLLYTHPVVQVAKNKISVDEEDGAPEKIIYENILSTAKQDNAALYGFSLKQHRRMRSKKLHHLDHPLVGILVYATPVITAVEKTNTN